LNTCGEAAKHFALFYDYKLTAKDIDLKDNFAEKLRAFSAFMNRVRLL
jgi:hypothetical protein